MLQLWLNLIPETVLTTTVIGVLAQSEYNGQLVSYSIEWEVDMWGCVYPPPKN